MQLSPQDLNPKWGTKFRLLQCRSNTTELYFCHPWIFLHTTCSMNLSWNLEHQSWNLCSSKSAHHCTKQMDSKRSWTKLLTKAFFDLPYSPRDRISWRGAKRRGLRAMQQGATANHLCGLSSLSLRKSASKGLTYIRLSSEQIPLVVYKKCELWRSPKTRIGLQ